MYECKFIKKNNQHEAVKQWISSQRAIFKILACTLFRLQKIAGKKPSS